MEILDIILQSKMISQFEHNNTQVFLKTNLSHYVQNMVFLLPFDINMCNTMPTKTVDTTPNKYWIYLLKDIRESVNNAILA